MNALKQLGLAALAATMTMGMAVTADDAPPPVPATPAPVLELVSAQPFELGEVTTHFWRAEMPAYRTGYLLVLKVNPDLVIPRATAEPILYVGNQTAERVNHGAESGYVIAVVPGVTSDAKHPDFIDLTRSPIWFGTPGLPEQVTAATIRDERRLASRSRIGAVPAAQVTQARVRGGEELRVRSKLELVREAAVLIERYSPQEQELVDALVPPATR